jgi:hypothetical protein
MPVARSSRRGASNLEIALERGANPGLANDEGGLPIDFARSKGHAEAERLLAGAA